MERSERNSLGSAIRDILVIGGLLAATNWLADRADFGWFDYNPTPWLLLPLLVGLRHGVAAGIIAGVVGAASVVAVHSERSVEVLRGFLQDHPFYFTALVFGGLMAGEIQRALRRDNVRLRDELKFSAEEVRRARAELELGRETRQQLQERLALHNASLACIDDDLRKLIAGPSEDLMERLLGLLHQHGGITSAGLYRLRGDELDRVAALNPTGPLEPEMHLDTVPIARRALSERSLISVKNAMETTKAQPFLAALPFEDPDGEGVLLIQDMPLSHFNWEHLARLEMILLWTSSLLIAREQATDERRLVPLPTFQVLVGHALATESAHHVPSIILKVQGAIDEAKRKGLLRLLPATATATQLPPNAGAGLAILMPFAGEADATAVAREFHQIDTGLRIANYLVAGGAQVEQFWSHLIQS